MKARGTFTGCMVVSCNDRFSLADFLQSEVFTMYASLLQRKGRYFLLLRVFYWMFYFTVAKSAGGGR